MPKTQEGRHRRGTLLDLLCTVAPTGTTEDTTWYLLQGLFACLLRHLLDRGPRTVVAKQSHPAG